MKNLIWSAAALAFLGMGSAMAADLPTYNAPYYKAPPAYWGWAGFYLGIEGGGGWGHATQTDTTPFSSGRYDTRGGLIGGTVGYNWQFNQTVFGFEGDGSGAWIKGSTAGIGADAFGGPCGGNPSICKADLQALGTVRARAGIAFDSFLPYVTGGFAVGSLHGSEGTGPGDTFGSGTSTATGWTVGGGLEMMLAPNWTAKAEYLHVDLGNHTVFTDTFPDGTTGPQRIKFTSEVVRLGLNYHFNWWGPGGGRY